MRLLIDNLDGTGATDWTGQVGAEGPVTVTRRLNEPSTCGFAVVAKAGGVLPRRLSRVVVSAEEGTVLFTGYVTREPAMEYVGEATEGSLYRARVTAESDEWLVDKQGRVPAGQAFGLAGDALLRLLSSRTGAQAMAAATTVTVMPARFAFDVTKTWSGNVGAVAAASYGSYRVLGGAVDLLPIGAVQHAVQASDGSLVPGGLEVRTGREPANDVTISGAMEAGAYVTEVFAGDGTTASFALAGAPYKAGAAVLVEDSFAGAALDRTKWAVSDPGSALGLGSAGLLLNGGNGQDGATTLAWLDQVELGGTLVLELNGVALNAGSDGVLLGLISGSTNRANCVAGFDVRTNNGTVTVQALVNGADAGSTFPLSNGHRYTLRLRMHCAAVQRVVQDFHVRTAGGLQSFGGGLVSAPVSVVLEARDEGASSNTPVTVLYDGGIANAAATASVVPVNSVQLLGSVSAVKVQTAGSAWVVSQTSGGPVTRLMGTAGQGVDCSVSAAGVVTFFAGRVPAAGEQVQVRYRTRQRAVARVQNAAAVAAEAATGLPGAACWTGHVLAPKAQSSEDCACAAAAVLAVASDAGSAKEGSYAARMGGVYGAAPLDVWPGDVLEVGGVPGVSEGLTARSVVVTDGGSVPETLLVKVEVANEWARPVAMRLSDQMAADVPGMLVVWPGPSWTVADLRGLTVTNVSTSAVTVDAGVAPPAGGGFEVRRRDGGFGPGQDGDLVLRSPVRGFSVPRSAQVEEFAVRMYDGSTPPVYSLRSAVVRTNVPVG